MAVFIAGCTNTQSVKNTEQNADINITAHLHCDSGSFEAPRGDTIDAYTNTDEWQVTSSVYFDKDSMYLYSSILSSEPHKYIENDLMAIAYKDIDADSAKLKAAAFDIDLEDGSKSHQVLIYVMAKNESRSFRNRIYTCLKKDVHFESNDMYSVSQGCKSIELANKIVGAIKSRLKQ